jgi:hypothetical protein
MLARNFQSLILLFAVVFVFSACHTAQKYAESGDYDGAIDFCIQKLKGKRKKKEEYVVGLETAFQKAQARDLARISQLQAENRPQNWARINQIYQTIDDRQQDIQPLLPLNASNGYKANFNFIDVAQLEFESRNKAAEYLYEQAISLIGQGEQGDKKAARNAYYNLEDLERRYFKDYKDKNALKQKARDLGTSYVLFEVKNNSTHILPSAFADQLLNMSKYDLDSEWKSFYFEAEKGVSYDYKVIFKVRDVDVSPEHIRERVYTDEKEIQDGWEYVLDKKGNVVKDSSGNDLKVPKYVRLRANVIEVFQSKAARLTGYVEIYDAYHNTLLDNETLSTEVVFENYASTFTGDHRALTEDSRCRIGNQPQLFPRDDEMLVQAAERLKPNLRDELRRNQAIF